MSAVPFNASLVSTKVKLSTLALSVYILLGVLQINAFLLRHELFFAHDLNDNVAHWNLVQRIDKQISLGHSPFDGWSPESAGGFPMLRDYQIGAHLLVVAIHRASFGLISLWAAFALCKWLAIVLMPMAFWWGARLLRLPDLTCGLVALISPLISTPGLYGLEYNSYVWGGNGSGMYPQSLATFGLLLAVGLAYRATFERSRKAATWAGVTVGLTLWTHWMLGWMAAVTVGIFAVAAMIRMKSRTPLLHAVLAGAIALTLFGVRIYNVFADRGVLLNSRWEPLWKSQSFGWEKVWGGLLAGSLLDYGRPAVLSVLALVGVFVAWKKRHDDRYASMLVGVSVWICLFAGLPTFPRWLLLPFGVIEGIHLHRAIAAVQVFLILLAGVGFTWTVEWARRRWAPQRVPVHRLDPGPSEFAGNFVAFALIIMLPLIPFIERARFLRLPTQWGEQTQVAFAKEGADLQRAIDAAKSTGGRIYAGKMGEWGGAFKVGVTQVWAELNSQLLPNVGYSFFPMNLPTDISLEFDDKDPAWYRVWNVTAVISPAGTPGPWFRSIGQYGRFKVWQVIASPGYFEPVEVTQAIKTDKVLFVDVVNRWMTSGQAAHNQYWLLDLGQRHDTILMPPIGDGPVGSIVEQSNDLTVPVMLALRERDRTPSDERHRQPNPTSAWCSVKMSRWGWVLYKVTYHPGWHAYVDGVPTQTVMLTPGFTGIPVAAGEHKIEMRYE